MPLPEHGRRESTRRPPKKVPSWHLTSPASMKYIKDADTRSKAKLAKATDTEKIKEEAVKAAKSLTQGRRK